MKKHYVSVWRVQGLETLYIVPKYNMKIYYIQKVDDNSNYYIGKRMIKEISNLIFLSLLITTDLESLEHDKVRNVQLHVVPNCLLVSPLSKEIPYVSNTFFALPSAHGRLFGWATNRVFFFVPEIG